MKEKNMNWKVFVFSLLGILTNANLVKSEYIMGGNIGRYETELGIFQINENKAEHVMTLYYPTASITHFSDFMQHILEGLKNENDITITRACFGVPGNTSEDRMFIQSPHLTFAVDGHELIEKNIIKHVLVINDFEVQAYGINALDESNLIQINKGIMRNNAPKLIIGAGAGLGSALLTQNPQQSSSTILPLGACYMDFAPQTLKELEYIAFLKKRIDENIITWGKILGSTGGIVAAYDFVDTKKEYNSTLETKNADAIFTHASSDEQCKDAVDFYLKLYARLIRNMAYAVLPHGGIYITNAIAIKHSSLFATPEFFEQLFGCQHPFMKAMLLDMPIFVITEPKISLYGAAYCLLSH